MSGAGPRDAMAGLLLPSVLRTRPQTGCSTSFSTSAARPRPRRSLPTRHGVGRRDATLTRSTGPLRIAPTPRRTSSLPRYAAAATLEALVALTPPGDLARDPSGC